MVAFDTIMGIFWLVCGIIVLIPAYMIAFGGRPDLHVHYDDSVDPAYVSRRAGATALLMGISMIVYALYQLVVGYQPLALGALLVSLLVLSTLTKRFAKGWGWDGERDSTPE
ncbi:hypothetical protein ACLI4U_16395 [Natrialbaceae archaeon A-CW2]